MLEDHPLDPALHDRQAFDCGVPVLNDYLTRLADQQRRRGITSVYVLTDTDEPSRILGFYTLSAAEVEAQRLDETLRKKLPRYPIPCFRLGRLASALGQRGKGIGKLLLACAVDRCLHARKQVAAFALLVDAKDDEAKSFYLKFGFSPLQDAPRTLYLPLGR